MGLDRTLSSEEQLDAAVGELVGDDAQENQDGDGERHGASDDEAFCPSRGARRHDAVEGDMGNPLMDRGVQTSRTSSELTTAFGAPARSPFGADPRERVQRVTRWGVAAAASIGLVLLIGAYAAGASLITPGSAGAAPSGALRGGGGSVPSEAPEAPADAPQPLAVAPAIATTASATRDAEPLAVASSLEEASGGEAANATSAAVAADSTPSMPAKATAAAPAPTEAAAPAVDVSELTGGSKAEQEGEEEEEDFDDHSEAPEAAPALPTDAATDKEARIAEETTA